MKVLHHFSRCSSRAIFTLALVLFIGLTGMSYGQSFPLTPTQETTVTIGALLPLTGSLSIMGETAKATMQIAKTDFEREFPLAHVELVIEDTASDAETALSKLQSMYQQGIQIFVGPFSSEELLHVKSFADENGCILISPTSTAPSLSMDDNIFRFQTNDIFQCYALSYYVQSKNVDRIIPVVRDDLYGQDFITAIATGFQGSIAVSDPIIYDPATVDFDSAAAQLAGKVEAVLQEQPDANVGVLAVSFNEITDLFNSASQYDQLKSLPWFGTDSSANNSIIAQDENAAAFAAQVQFTASVSNPLAWAHPEMSFSFFNQLLLIRVNQLYDSPQEPLVSDMYDAFWLGGLTQFMDSPNLKEALLTASNLYGGLSGSPLFDENGDTRVIGYCFYKYQNGGAWPLVGSFQAINLPDGSLGYVQFSDKQVSSPGMDRNVKIGALLSLTGNYGERGQQIREVLELSQQSINSVLQRIYTPNSSMDLIVEDTATDPDTALQKMIKLHEQGVRYFVGPLTSAELERVASYAEENGLVIVSPSSTASALSLNDTIFRLTMNDKKQTKALAALMADRHYSRATVLYRNDVYGSGFYQDFKAAFEEVGGTCDEGVSYETGATDFTQTVQQLEALVPTQNHSSYAIVLVGFGEDVIQLLNSIPNDSVLMDLRWFGTDGVALNAGVLNDSQTLQFALQTDLTASIWGTDFPRTFLVYNKVVLNEVKDQLNFDLSAFDIASYEALGLYLGMMERMDWDASPSLEQSIDALRTVTSTFVGLMAPAVLNEAGDREYGIFDFYEVTEKNGGASWTPYAEYLFDQITGGESLTYSESPTTSSFKDWELFQ